jgi:MraZ protein
MSAASIEGFFVGEFRHALDPKRRVTIPSEWRAVVGPPDEMFVLPSTKRRCLVLRPARDMGRVMERLRGLPAQAADAQKARMILASQAQRLTWDGQGRIRVRDGLLDFAEIGKAAVLVGNFDSFALWSPERWAEYNQPQDSLRVLDLADGVDI